MNRFGHGIGYYNASNNAFSLSTDEAKAAVERFQKKLRQMKPKTGFMIIKHMSMMQLPV